uniref:DNA-binding protein n=1 Tax=Thermus caliditerrae TaxID=1330700 RepID=A0A7C5RE44_9DEIN
MTKRFLTVGEVARELGISPATVRGLIARGWFPGARRIGKWWRIPREEVERLKSEQGTEAISEARDA